VDLPRVTFGIIVLNGEPFARYCLRSLYPFAHEIIVVEGAVTAAANAATPEGHSTDGTLETLFRFKAEEDPDNKLQIVTRDGLWPEKDEQSQAYAERATGDYLWQVDIDEFYKPEDVQGVLRMLTSEPTITQVNVQWLNFWGGFNVLVDGLFLRRHYRDLGGGVPRVFKWGPGHSYVTHRPPTVRSRDGADMRQGHWIRGEQLARTGTYCYHYATVFPQLVERKMTYYQGLGWDPLGNFEEWYHNTFVQIRRPFRVHHVSSQISWLTPFRGTHPPQIQALLEGLSAGTWRIRQRQNGDVLALMENRRYRTGVYLLQRTSTLLVGLSAVSPGLAGLVEATVERLFSPRLGASRSEAHG
jgi:hypothetical protein